MTECTDHWPTVVLGPGGYPFIRCFHCPHVIPRAEAPADLILDCVTLMTLIRGESCRALTVDELAALHAPATGPGTPWRYVNRSS